ncbi:NADP-dependent oxidoreductase [Hymenobacter lapidiphilus]|uniref:NADP-dependent oxidoreductase n=1 Tax=Hymenobacter lapidiphilus TaxID=2608003 RepID=A0A7Y7PQX7_9BACT|nr:NADP-dependent oxidoreductase [Hymenobacter lapidiphilus]NVO32255.1 NADP-dependent oxidoreductase [Hymenobacter lapidiphilus]
MKAILATGPQSVHYADKAMPAVGRGQVLVHVLAAGVNPVDWKMLSHASSTRPRTPGCDFSGVVAALGPGVHAFQLGDAVYGSLGVVADGTFAEYITGPADFMARKPRSLSHEQAAAVPVAATTAWQALFDYANVQAGQRVLVHAAAGGVGLFAAQLAKWKGAYVIGTASGRNEAFVRALGVDEFIDYGRTAFERALPAVDVVVDTVGGATADKSWAVLKKGGFFVSAVGAANEQQALQHRVRAANFLVVPDASQLQQIGQLLDAGQLRVHVQQTFPLSAAAEALDLSRQGHVRGKLVLTTPG